MNLPDHIHPIAVDDALLNIGMTINEIRALTGDTTPTIIRTVEELEALDPDTVLMIEGAEAMTWEPRDLIRFKLQGGSPFPAVVVTTAEQVRAAREALEEA